MRQVDTIKRASDYSYSRALRLLGESQLRRCRCNQGEHSVLVIIVLPVHYLEYRDLSLSILVLSVCPTTEGGL